VGGTVVAALADLVLPRTCAGCALPGATLCRVCAGLLTHPFLATPRRVPWGFPPTVAAGVYGGPVRPAVIAFKERGRAELARPLGTALALAVAAATQAVPERHRPVLLVPVPSSRAALRTRGRDHVRELTRHAVGELRAAGLPAAEARLLRRRGRVRDSAELSAAARRTNLAGSFVLAPAPPRPARRAVLVLVDDVVTSGATLTEAARVLTHAVPTGSPPVLAAVVAATPRTADRQSSAGDLHVVPERSGKGLDRLSGRGRSD
jgi:predicted amidophosphoribosyltransferase